MYAATAYGATDDRPARTRLSTTRTRPNVATTSASHSPAELREVLDSRTAGRENMRLATIAPAAPPATCAATYPPVSRRDSVPPAHAARDTTGLRCPPDT